MLAIVKNTREKPRSSWGIAYKHSCTCSHSLAWINQNSSSIIPFQKDTIYGWVRNEMPQRPQIIQEAAQQKLKEPTRTLGKRNIAQRLISRDSFFQRRGVIMLAKKTLASSLQLWRITCNFTSDLIAFYQTLPQYFSNTANLTRNWQTFFFMLLHVCTTCFRVCCANQVFLKRLQYSATSNRLTSPSNMLLDFC